MNAVNRVLVVVGVLIALPLGVAVMVAPVPVLGVVLSGLHHLMSWVQGVPLWARFLVGILFALAWLVLCVLLLILELRRPPRRTVRVERVDGGVAEVSMGTVTNYIVYELEQMPGVLRAHPRASVRRGAVVVEVDVDMAGSVEVPAEAARLVGVIRKVVEEKVGVRLAGPPKVRLKAAPAPAVVRRPVGGPPPAANP